MQGLKYDLAYRLALGGQKWTRRKFYTRKCTQVATKSHQWLALTCVGWPTCRVDLSANLISIKVNASQRKSWPNRVASRHKLTTQVASTCVSIWERSGYQTTNFNPVSGTTITPVTFIWHSPSQHISLAVYEKNYWYPTDRDVEAFKSRIPRLLIFYGYSQYPRECLNTDFV